MSAQRVDVRTALQPFLRDYQFASIKHGKTDDNAIEVDAAEERLIAAIEQRDAAVAELIEAAADAQQDRMDQVVECHGDRCRELNCASCFGEDMAEQYVERANARATRLRAALARCTGEGA